MMAMKECYVVSLDSLNTKVAITMICGFSGRKNILIALGFVDGLSSDRCTARKSIYEKENNEDYAMKTILSLV